MTELPQLPLDVVDIIMRHDVLGQRQQQQWDKKEEEEEEEEQTGFMRWLCAWRLVCRRFRDTQWLLKSIVKEKEKEKRASTLLALAYEEEEEKEQTKWRREGDNSDHVDTFTHTSQKHSLQYDLPYKASLHLCHEIFPPSMMTSSEHQHQQVASSELDISSLAAPAPSATMSFYWSWTESSPHHTTNSHSSHLHSSIAQGISNTPSGGFLLLYPGVYVENVRLTKNVMLIGMGPRGSVIIEGQGWEPTITTTGLGSGANKPSRRGGNRNGDNTIDNDNNDSISEKERRRSTSGGGAYVNDVMAHVKEGQTGERAGLVNIVVRHRNELQSCSVYIPIGEPAFIDCDIHGGIRIAGSESRPLISNCSITESRSVGIAFTDHAMGTIIGSSICNCRGSAIQIDRYAAPWISCKVDAATVDSPAIQLSTTAQPQGVHCQHWDHHHSASIPQSMPKDSTAQSKMVMSDEKLLSSLSSSIAETSSYGDYRADDDQRLIRCFLHRRDLENISLRIVVIEQLTLMNNKADDEAIMHGADDVVLGIEDC